MTLERADRLKAPPVVGRFYLVHAVRWSFEPTGDKGPPETVIRALANSDDSKWWPVWGRKHNDVQFFGFDNQHYHIDPRFLTKRHWLHFKWSQHTPLGAVQGKPLNHRYLPDGPPKPQLRRMKCTRADVSWMHPDQPSVGKLNKSFAGQKCRKSRLGLVCPHQRFPLGSIVPIDGVITCPLHGLRIDAETGVCLGPESRVAI